MLALSRGKNESILVGSEIVLTVLDVCVDEVPVSGARVKLSFQAPRDVRILREEVAARQNRGFDGGTRRSPPAHRPGRVADIPDATVRLLLRLPETFDLPIYRDRLPRERSQNYRRIESLKAIRPSGSESISEARSTIVDVTCQLGESILIGKELVIMVASVGRFVPTSRENESSR